MNVGYLESQKNKNNYDCYIFHDVDLLPQIDSTNSYRCDETYPVHMSSAVDKHGYKLFYESAFGGATAFTREMFEKVKGYPNRYFGWGSEDDDLSNRVRRTFHVLKHLPESVGRYQMIKHGRDALNVVDNDARMKNIAYWLKYWDTDNVHTIEYQVLSKERLNYHEMSLIWISITYDMKQFEKFA